ncbi:MAG: cation:proton antiporter [Proteobacteria bacterium]|nr:cation:proton antiporter [Pseudomonadota bacterium]
MIETFLNNPSLTISLALVSGIIAQAIAYHIRIPGIVILLATGVLMGPDVSGIIRPQSLGIALKMLTGFAVAIILFEGGMNLKINRLKREKRSIRQLITIGGPITIAGGALAAKYILEWDWRMSLLFGTLVMVTGPTVINPLLRRLKVKRNVATVLEAEGVLIDAIGAIVAIVALEAALSPEGMAISDSLLHIFICLGTGTVLGLLFGFLLVSLLRTRDIVPEGIENVFTLCIVLALFQVANIIKPESGIAAVTVAGIVVGNAFTFIKDELAEFKEELTVMMIGMLFVLLAADVRMAEVKALGLPGIATVAILIFIVRPLNVYIGTIRTGLSFKERSFIAWIGPRGIVAAAVASLFASEFAQQGLSGGNELRAMVFLVITVTVLCAGLTGGFVASILGLKRPNNFGWVILGANELARAIAKIFKENGQEVVSIDANPDACRAAEEDCTRVIFGNALQTNYLLRAEIETRKGALAITSNEEVNFLFLQKAKKEAKQIKLYGALRVGSETITPQMMENTGAEVLFLKPVDVELWAVRIRRRHVLLQKWQYNGLAQKKRKADTKTLLVANMSCVPVMLEASGKLEPIGSKTDIRKGNIVLFLVYEQEREKIQSLLGDQGWQSISLGEDFEFTTTQCYIDEDI